MQFVYFLGVLNFSFRKVFDIIKLYIQGKLVPKHKCYTILDKYRFLQNFHRIYKRIAIKANLRGEGVALTLKTLRYVLIVEFYQRIVP